MNGRRITGTYRLQLTADFGFDAATRIVPYLAELGVSHVYCSPYLQAAAGSTHGYDVVDPETVNVELGGEEARARFCAALAAHGLGQVLDVVPNHMAITTGNRWWADVLENGPSSRFAAFFDVDWEPPEARLRNTLLLPVLGDLSGNVLEAGEIKLEREGGKLALRYFDATFPVAPRSIDDLLRRAAARCGSEELAFLADAFGGLPLSTATDWESVHRRHRDKEVLARLLAELLARDDRARRALDAVLAETSGSPDALDALLMRQNYRLAYWRAAGRDLGYRRFFDINSLIGLRMEDERVFDATHVRVLGWLRDGSLDGIRVDHPDGLRDPEEYLQRLRRAAPDAWIVVEKILEHGERLRASWPADGTTGYDFLNVVQGLFVDPAARAPFSALYAEVTGGCPEYGALVRENKRLVLRELLGSDLNRLTALLLDVCERHRAYRDFTRHELHEALGEYVACLEVYRTYVRAGRDARLDREDEERVEAAIARAKAERPDLDSRLFDVIAAVMLLRVTGELESEFLRRLQQFTGSVMAKGAEDTTFYAFTRYVVLNEVGGDPDAFGRSLASFHDAARLMQAEWPRGMLATSTHDTKRGEDVRARLALLSEMPDAWATAVRRLRDLAAPHRGAGPDPATELLYYQTLVGAWPISAERVAAYLQKACREAKTHTSWLEVDETFEAATRAFVEATLGDAAFTQAVDAFVRPLVAPGRVTSLAQALIKLTSPGVPDVYQGCELWDDSLVDPDNRREVDYDRRRRLLAELGGAPSTPVVGRDDGGVSKLLVTSRALRLRRRVPEAFDERADYFPLTAEGDKAAHVVAFVRGGAIVSIAPRLAWSLGGDWGDTTLALPVGIWRDELTGATVEGGVQPVSGLLQRFPVALLSKQ